MTPEERARKLVVAWYARWGVTDKSEIATSGPTVEMLADAIRAAVEAERERIFQVLGRPVSHSGSFGGELVFHYVLTAEQVRAIREGEK